MEPAWGSAARSVIDRAFALAVERGAKVTTLHLAASLMEHGTDGAKLLVARGLRPQDLRSAGKVHAEAAGTFERVQSSAKLIASNRASEPGPADLLIAALGEPESALAAMVGQLGCDAGILAEEVLRTASVSVRKPARNAIIHSGMLRNGSQAAPAAANPEPSRPPVRIVQERTPSRGVSSRAASQSAKQLTLPTTVPPINAPGSKEAVKVTAVPAPAKGEMPRPGAILATGPDPRPIRTTQRAPRTERTEHDLDARTFPALTMLARNLSADGIRGTLEPVVGREKEIRRVLDAVARREGRGALVVGAAGVGKSTLLRAIARESFGRAVILLRHSEVAAQARGQQGAERARTLVEELLRASERIVLALDPAAPWFLSRDLPEELVLELRSALATGKLSWIGTATSEEARKLAESEAWLERASVRVDLDEPTSVELREMVRAYAPAITAYHGVVADPLVLEHAAELSERYLGGRAQPDRALTVVDLALARARRAKLPALMREDVAGVVAEIGGIPFDRVSASDNERLLELESWLSTRVVGHGSALQRVAHTLRRNAVGFRGARPIGTFLFLGPTGVGKTETAKAVAEAMFPGAGAMTRFDMAEFAEPQSVARLVGAPPGYVGYHDGGQLTETVRRRPYQLILLDEIEKAHRDVLESLLALLDEGRMTDGRGRTMDFRNTVIVMTSNLGAELYTQRALQPARAIGFGNDTPRMSVQAETNDRVREAARAALPPELWNRIDEPVVFGPLSRDEVTEVAWRLLKQSFARLEAEQGIAVVAKPGVVDLLLDQGGYEPSLGARPMRRAIARLVEAPLAEAVLRGTLRRGDLATLEARDWGVEVLIGARH